MPTTVTRKGQVTIPKLVRKSLDIHPGTKVEFEINSQGDAILRKVRPAEVRPDRFDRAIGSAEIQLGCPTDEYMEMIRGYASDPS
jgi:AbrB family looped-hinge helix DNA binding protein